MIKLFILISLLFVSFAAVFAQNAPKPALPAWFNGITLDDLDFSDGQAAKIRSLPDKTVVRIVFDADKKAEDYKNSLNNLRSLNGHLFIMGEIIDSDFMAKYRWECLPAQNCSFDEDAAHKFHDFKTRIDNYLSVLSDKVDVWEFGNEINGEWADEGCVKNPDDACFSDVREETVKGVKGMSHPNRTQSADKIAYALTKAKATGLPVALTLIHQPDCPTWSQNTMNEWTNTYLAPKVTGIEIDYLLISYYEDNCDQGKSTTMSEKFSGMRKEDFEKLSKPEQKRLKKDFDKLTAAEKDHKLRGIYWTQTFNDLSKTGLRYKFVGFGEVGYSSDAKSINNGLDFENAGEHYRASKKDYLEKYYKMDIKTANYIGGHFWWSFSEDIAEETGNADTFYRNLIAQFKTVP